ncbi:MAG: DUF4124 domain-containing protein, partial [Gammaproteobacteria bacterium]|nr:DUF4124 domain-containing protein [Gammaproteobacteria bacterium]
VLVTLPADAALYRWVDERGVVQFSDQPPPKHADGASISLDVPQPASGTTPLTKSISQRSESLSKSGGKATRNKPRKSRSTNTARRSASSRSRSSSRGSTRRTSPTVRASSY